MVDPKKQQEFEKMAARATSRVDALFGGEPYALLYERAGKVLTAVNAETGKVLVQQPRNDLSPLLTVDGGTIQWDRRTFFVGASDADRALALEFVGTVNSGTGAAGARPAVGSVSQGIRPDLDPTADAIQRLILALAALVLVVGVVLGIVPVSTDDVPCGSAFFMGSGLSEAGKEYCTFEGGAGTRRLWAIGLLLGGVAMFIVAQTVRTKRPME